MLRRMDLLASRAYGIFLAEIDKQLGYARDLLAAPNGPGQAERAEAAIMFHTLKGGAGFFGFGEIAQLAGEVEEILIAPNFASSRDIPAIQSKVDAIENLRQKLPDPRI